jgi:hypothetical protein
MPAAVTEEQLLRAWEATLAERPARRAAALLADCNDTDAATVARWSMAERDAALFDLRQAVFGREAAAVTHCPSCGEQMEALLDLSRLRPASTPADDAVTTIEGFAVRIRMPNTDDLVSISTLGDERAALAALVARCVESVHSPAGLDVPFTEAPAGVTDAIRAHLADRLDAIGAELSLTCASCRATFRVPFDIAGFLLRELDVWAGRLIREVHALARAYGWDESTIMRLSPRRRRAYLDLVEASR